MDSSVPPFGGDLIPDVDVESHSAVPVSAPPATVYAAARELDMSRSLVIRTLFRLRGLPPSALNAAGLEVIRFKVVREQPPTGFALGIVGRFWTPSGDLVDFDPNAFATFDEPGYAKALWSFGVTPLPDDVTLLETWTRVKALDARSRRSFSRYWRLIGPFSGLIRSRVLGLVRDAAEGGMTKVNTNGLD